MTRRGVLLADVFVSFALPFGVLMVILPASLARPGVERVRGRFGVRPVLPLERVGFLPE